MLQQTAPSRRRNRQRASIAHPLDPFQLKAPARQCRADRAADVRSPFRPIQTRPTEYAALRSRMREIDAELAEKFRPGRRDFAGFVAEDDMLVLDQPLGQADAEHTGDVIVTGAGVTQVVVEMRIRLEPRRAF